MKKLWFKAKWFGWGWYPASGEGWMATFAYILALFTVQAAFVAGATSANVVWASAALVAATAGLTAAMMEICRKTGEPPRWRWRWPGKPGKR